MVYHSKNVPPNEKELTKLVTTFCNFLVANHSSHININMVADALRIEKKRRLSDISNVLEGIGLVEKVNKHDIIWKGGNAYNNGPEFQKKHRELKENIQDIDKMINETEEKIKQLKQSLRNVMEEPDNIRHAFVTTEDLKDIQSQKTLLVVKAPIYSRVTVTADRARDGSQEYKMSVRSTTTNPKILYIKDVPGRTERGCIDLTQEKEREECEHLEAMEGHIGLEYSNIPRQEDQGPFYNFGEDEGAMDSFDF